MNSVKLSSKYQIVIPKRIRKELDLKSGQRFRIDITKSGDITIKTNSALDEFVGSVPGAWGNDPVAYVREQRDAWDD